MKPTTVDSLRVPTGPIHPNDSVAPLRTVDDTMKTVRRILVLATLVLMVTACTSTSAPDSTSDTTADQVATTTTNPGLPPASGETEIACDPAAISASYGERIRLEACTTTWAMGDTERDSWQCGPDPCRNTRIYTLDNGRWVDAVTCDRQFPLTRYAHTCFIPDVGLATIEVMPPRDVACILWPADTSVRFVRETGCALSEESVRASLDEPCTGYFERFELPLEKCSRGEMVREAMERLRQLGFVRNIDEYFGNEMANGVHSFQKQNALLATGVIDDETWSALQP